MKKLLLLIDEETKCCSLVNRVKHRRMDESIDYPILSFYYDHQDETYEKYDVKKFDEIKYIFIPIENIKIVRK